MGKKTAVIVCAAGASSRFGGKQKKIFAEVNKTPVAIRSINLFADMDDVCEIILAISPKDEEIVKIRWGATLAFNSVKLCLGGSERFDTVKNALAMVSDEAQQIAVHDAARCCCKKEWITEVFEMASKTGSAMLATPVIGTVKRVEAGLITGTVDRSCLWEAQTPQVFDKGLLLKGYQKLEGMDKSKLTDDSMLIESMGEKVSVVQTDNSNIKITNQADVAMAEAILKSREKPTRSFGAFEEAQW